MSTARERLAAIPHLQVGDKVKRHDIGDDLARRHGVWVAPVACDRGQMPTTLVTRNRERVKCSACLEARTDG